MPELRKDPILNRWVIIATERAKRPQDYDHEVDIPKGGPCPFCPGMEHMTPRETLIYRTSSTSALGAGWNVRVVPNKFPALKIEGDLDRRGVGLYDIMNAVGAHEVIIETPDHGKPLAEQPVDQVERVIWAYRDRALDLQKDPRFRYMLIFKNHGAAAGATLDHPHSQLIALPTVPEIPHEEIKECERFYGYKERCLFCDILRQEMGDRSRVVDENDDFLTFCPFAPRFPFETWIAPKRHMPRFEASSESVLQNFARSLSLLLRKINKSLRNPPYNYMIHSSPVAYDRPQCYHWHLEFTPKLTRVAGFEVGTGFYINSTRPEDAARFMRELVL
ncbi:MAG: galactose-1-phosphate uridylyltransferase [Myxococcales bacterium]|nr:galactose-1-phosphate uridylyltransferase [Myxococcales bacterium]